MVTQIGAGFLSEKLSKNLNIAYNARFFAMKCRVLIARCTKQLSPVGGTNALLKNTRYGKDGQRQQPSIGWPSYSTIPQPLLSIINPLYIFK